MIPDSPPLLGAGFHAVPPGHLAAVVTALEMRAPPAPPATPARAPEGLALTRAETLAPDAYRAVFRRVGEPWLWVSRLTWSDAQAVATIHDPKVEVWLLGAPGANPAEAVGICELDARIAGQCEVAYFGLAPGFTGKGVGRWMMERGLQRAWSLPGVSRVWIHTCTLDSPAALPFYIARGFTPYRRQVEILADPRIEGSLPRDASPREPVIIP